MRLCADIGQPLERQLGRAVTGKRFGHRRRGSGPGVRSGRCPPRKKGQRGWNLQPGGGAMGFGGSPFPTMVRAGRAPKLATGIAASRRLGIGVQRPSRRDRRRAPVPPTSPRVHHRHPVGHVPDHGEIMGDDDQRQAELVLQVLQKIDHLTPWIDTSSALTRLVPISTVGPEKRARVAMPRFRWRLPSL